MNLVRATKHILDVLWSPPHDPNLSILTNSSDSITLGHIAEARRYQETEPDSDIIALTFVFSQLLLLTCKADRYQNRYAIMQVMNELSGIMEKHEFSWSETNFIHTRCLTEAYKAFIAVDVVHERLLETMIKHHPDPYILHW